MSLLKLPPLSLYVHTPWCIKKCPYCDFNSQTLKGNIPESDYAAALEANITSQWHHLHNRPISSIFIGGGTPSLLSPAFYQDLFSYLRRHTMLSDGIEITLEANPGSVEQQRFKAYREIGINRLSLGIQSFQNKQLKNLGRIHDANQAIKAVAMAQQAGFENINLDLMFGLPQQTLEDALYDLKLANDLQPQHLSWYQLTIEPNTYFYKHRPALPHDDAIERMQEAGHRFLDLQGFKQYEVSAFCRNGDISQHNMHYWEFGDYLGIGAGAHSKITDISSRTIMRLWNIRNASLYIDAPSRAAGSKIITTSELPLEFMMNALRLQRPATFSMYEARTGLPRNTLIPILQKAKQYDWLTWNTESIILTDSGRQLLNEVLELWLPEPTQALSSMIPSPVTAIQK